MAVTRLQALATFPACGHRTRRHSQAGIQMPHQTPASAPAARPDRRPACRPAAQGMLHRPGTVGSPGTHTLNSRGENCPRLPPEHRFPHPAMQAGQAGAKCINLAEIRYETGDGFPRQRAGKAQVRDPPAPAQQSVSAVVCSDLAHLTGCLAGQFLGCLRLQCCCVMVGGSYSFTGMNCHLRNRQRTCPFKSALSCAYI